MTNLKLIMRVEFSPSRGGFYEVLQCGHFGQKRNKKFPYWAKVTRKGEISVVGSRICKECANKGLFN